MNRPDWDNQFAETEEERAERMAASRKRMNERLAAARQRRYDALKAHDPDLYRRTIDSAEAITLNFNLPQKVAVEIESACVSVACDALNLKWEAA